MSDDIASMRREDANHSIKCYLLDLPGELRNRIYSYTLEERPTVYQSRRDSNGDHEPAVSRCAKAQPRGFIGLTQACRQLRAEYAPIYVDHTKIHICHFDVPEYVLTGCPFVSRYNGELAGNIYLDCRPGRSATDPYSDPEPIDILPLIQVCQENPNVRARCGQYGCVSCDCGVCAGCVSNQYGWLAWEKDGLNHLFDVAKRPVLWQWLDEAIDKIILTNTVDGLRFVTKRGKEEDWMVARPGMEKAWEEHGQRIGFPFSTDMVRFKKWPGLSKVE